MISSLDKKSLRRSAMERRMFLGENEHRQLDHLLCVFISRLDAFKDADTVLLYAPTRLEPNLLPLARLALSLGKCVAFPISHTEDCTLDFRTVVSTDELVLGSYDIMEPAANAPVAHISEQTLCIVPALSYDRQGFRLGYGKGYYDRFLKDFRGISVGTVHSSLLCDRLPTIDTDIPVNIIITETGVIHLNEI